jgi:hypothetical protein
MNGKVVFVNETRLVLNNIPFTLTISCLPGYSYSYLAFDFLPIVYTLPQWYGEPVTSSYYSSVESPLSYFLNFFSQESYSIYFEVPMLIDSEILGGNYGTLQVTYQLTEYPITIALKKALVYSWYQGPNVYNYTATQYLFPAVLITPSIYALVNATSQPINTFYAVGYVKAIPTYNDWGTYGQGVVNYPLSLVVAQDNISGATPLLYVPSSPFAPPPNPVASIPWAPQNLLLFGAYYVNTLPIPLIGLYTPPYDYPLPPMFTELPFMSQVVHYVTAKKVSPYITLYYYYNGLAGPLMPYIPGYGLFNMSSFISLHDIYANYYVPGIYEYPWPVTYISEPWANNELYALPLDYYILYDFGSVNNLTDFLSQELNNPFIDLVKIVNASGSATVYYWYLASAKGIYSPRVTKLAPFGYGTYHEELTPANISITPLMLNGTTPLNGTYLVCIRSNTLRQIGPVSYYPMNISGVVPSLDVGIYYVLGKPLSGFFVPLFQAVNVTSLCFVPTLNGTYFIIVYMPPQSLLKSVYLHRPAVIGQLPSSLPLTVWQIINTMGASYTPELIALTNTTFAMDNRDVVNPLSPNVLWLNIVQTQYVIVTTNLTALKLLFPNATITPFSVNITSNGTLTSSGTGVVIVNASSTTPTPITYSGGASLSIMQVQYMATYFAGVTAKVVLNTVGTDLTPLVARLGLPLFSVNGTASTSPIAVLALPKANDTIRICIPPAIGPIVVVNSGCFNAAITANETLPLVIYVRLPVNLNITAINNNGKLVVKVVGADFFGNPVVYYPINVTVYLGNGTAAYTAVIRNGIAEVSTGLPYQGNALITAQGNGTGAYLPASAATYVPVTSVSTLPPWLAYVGSIWWLLLLVILLVVLIVVMMILERKRAKKRRVRAYTPYWV